MENRLEEVRTLLLSLLIARKGATPIPVLERDYYEIENKRIPCRQFGYENVVQFLQSMPEHFVVEEYNGNWCIRGIASNKSKHVSSLVSRQKTTFNNPRIRCSRQSFVNRYVQHTKPQQVRIAYDKLYLFMQYVKNNPNGVSLQNAMLFVQQLVPNVNISPYDFQTQLYELSHQLRLDGNMIYPILNDSQSNATQQPSNQPLTEEPMQLWNESKFLNDSASPPTQQTIYLAGQEEFEWITCHEESDEDDLLVSRNDTHNGRRVKTSEVLATNLAQYVKSEQTDTVNYNEIDMEINEENLTMMSNNNIEIKAEISQDKSEIVSDRIKSRLVKLLQKYPNGIWCAELPDIYLQEYKVHLNYDKLGFTSVREFTSYLPKIFYMTQLYKDDDFKLYSADKRPVVPKTESVDIIQDSHNQYDKHRTAQVQCSNNYDDAPIPSDVSPNITKRFAPNDVMNYGDDVNKILVTDLQCTKKFLEVYIMEVFNPSFFWIHLRENRRPFDRMMDELFNFYELNKDIYTIAKVALRKDLNCACIYSGRWHRGIIRSVKPDFRVTVFFYDYGTMKTYAPEDIYYLHKQFSVFPAQAIPCGLYNVKPCVGDRWKRTVHDRFIDRVAETLLAATIISIDTLNNSMMVILTDTTEEEDVCINDWLVKEKLAHVGKMADAVDMASIMKYVVNNLNQIPSYCFAEENLMPENCYKTTSIEEKIVSPGSTLSHYDNQYQQQPVKPPPGFQPLIEQCIPSNTSTRNYQNNNNYSFANSSNVLNTKAPVFGDMEAMTNPFLFDQQFIPNDIAKQMYMSIWNENKKLQIEVTEILCDLLEQSPLSFKDQIQLNKILTIIKAVLLDQKDNYSAVVKTPIASNIASGTTLNDNLVQKTPFNVNSETANISSMSNPFNINVDDRSQSNATFSTYDSDSFKSNWSQSDKLSSSQMPSASPMPSIFINNTPSVSTVPQKVNQDGENIPLTSVSPAVSTNSFSEMDTVNTQFANMFKDTNPFKFSTDVSGTQISETQNERMTNNYNTGVTSYLSTPQSNTTQIETAKSNCFTPVSNLGHVNKSYTSRIVYESGPVMYNTQKKQADADANARQNACSNSNFGNVQNAQSFKLGECNKRSTSQVSQFANDIASPQIQHNIINHDIKDNSQNDENYVTRLSTYFMKGSQLMNGESTYYHQNDNADNLRPSSSQSWNQTKIPEHWTNSKFQNNMSLINHSESTFGTPITLSYQDWNRKKLVNQSLEMNEAIDSSNFFKVNNSLDKERMDTYANSCCRNNENKSIQERNMVYNPFLFQKIDSVQGITFIFNFEQDGWILTYEFVETFTNLKLYSHFLNTLNVLNIKVIFKEILRSQYPIQFSQLDRYPLNVPRDSEKRILSINLISLQTALALLHKLKIVSREQIENAFKKNEFVDGSVLPTLWTLIVTYRNLKQRIELYSNYL